MIPVTAIQDPLILSKTFKLGPFLEFYSLLHFHCLEFGFQFLNVGVFKPNLILVILDFGLENNDLLFFQD